MVSIDIFLKFILSMILLIPSPWTGEGADNPPKIVGAIKANTLSTSFWSKNEFNRYFLFKL